MEAYNNTLVGGGWGTLIFDGAGVAEKNIIVTYKEDMWPVRLYPGAEVTMDYNLYYAPNSPHVGHDGSAKTWEQWGYGGLNVDPQLDDEYCSVFEIGACE